MGLGIQSRPAPLRPAGRSEGPRFTALRFGAKVLHFPGSSSIPGVEEYSTTSSPSKRPGPSEPGGTEREEQS